MISRNPEATPLMRQYSAFKRKYPDALLLFRVGDFYETFGEDAVRAAKILGITLTRRSGMELAGVPYHALDTYLPRLVRAGLRVAVCDQLEDAKLVKSGQIVRRGVTELITPGLTATSVLEHKENNFLASVHLGGKENGAAFLDLSTGEFFAAQGTDDYVDKLLASFAPKEVLFQQGKGELFVEKFGTKYYTYKLDDYAFSAEGTLDKMLRHFEVQSLKGFGIHEMPYGVAAAGAILFYLELTQHSKLAHIAAISRIDESRYVWLDKFTARNLELFSPNSEGAQTLVQCLDKTISPMGGRLLRRWIALPLKDTAEINHRLDIVDAFKNSAELSAQIAQAIRDVGDLERVVGRVSTGRIQPREMVQLARSLRSIHIVKTLCATNPALSTISEGIGLCEEVCSMVEKTLTAEPPAIGKGAVIAQGVSEALDELRTITQDSDALLKQVELREISRTGIPIKIDFNSVFGYYIEVRNTHKNRVPPDWIRKQTLTNAERYITADIKEYEQKKLTADEKILALEQQIFAELTESVVPYIPTIQRNAALVAQLDVLLCFSVLAAERQYVRPVLTTDGIIDIRGGRHPVIEEMLPAGECYIANDLWLDRTQQQIIILTGPNMSGKSALLRQTALIVLLSQIGCPVPAASASIGIVDKIFTRVGASDNITQGESTFMVEMQEAASILNNLSKDSLVLLDEIGRGTSTYDGISIACAMVEHIHNHPTSPAKTIFATHYHELNDMAQKFERIKNYSIAVQEVEGKVVFLRKLVAGGTAHSYGIHVAQMAGMPQQVCLRAADILSELELKSTTTKTTRTTAKLSSSTQMSFFEVGDPVLAQIRSRIANLDLNSLTPLEALNILHAIKDMTNAG